MTCYPQYPYLAPYPTAPAETHGCMAPWGFTMKVDGVGSVTVQPDIAEVLLGVRTESTDLTTAQSTNAAAITSVINTLKRLGVAERDIATQSYTISPQYDYVEGKQIFRGYRVQHTLKATIRNTAQIGPIIDAAVAAGANFVSNISFTVANPSLLYQQALTLAIENATAKAMTIGRKLNVTVSPVPIRIVEETLEGAPIEPGLLKLAEAVPTPIQVGQLDITAQIEAVFTYSYR